MSASNTAAKSLDFCRISWFELYLLTYLILLVPLAHKANTRDRQPPVFRAKCSTWAHDNPFSFISRSNDLLHVSFGLPRLRLPAFGVHLNAIFGIASDGILITCPIQAHLLRLISVIMDEVDVFRCNSIFEMVLGQNIFKFLRRHLF